MCVFRKATPEDLEEIWTFTSAAAIKMQEQGIFQWDECYPMKEDFQEDINKSQLYVGMIDGRIAVVYALNQECEEDYKNGDWKYLSGPFYFLHRLCVNPAFQNQGIGKAAMLHMEKESKAMGARGIRLDVFQGNPYSLRLYEGMGYTRAGSVAWRMGTFYFLEKRI